MNDDGISQQPERINHFTYINRLKKMIEDGHLWAHEKQAIKYAIEQLEANSK